MTIAHTGPASANERYEQWLSTGAALAVGASFFALWFWLLPGWLGFRVEIAGAARLRWLAAIPSVLGFARCPALRLGLWLDGSRHSHAGHSAEAISCCGLLSLCTQSDVRGFRGGMDRALDHFRPC